MKINKIRIKGWRSYDDTDGIKIDSLKNINLFIGPNNAGKSNLFWFFHELHNAIANKLQNLSSTPAGSINYITSSNFSTFDFWGHKGQQIVANIEVTDLPDPFPHQKFKVDQSLWKSNLVNLGVQIKVEEDKKSTLSCFSLMQPGTEEEILEVFKTSPKIFEPGQGFVEANDTNAYYFATEEVWKFFSNTFLFVDAVRHPKGREEKNESQFQVGQEIIKKIYQKAIDKKTGKEWREFRKSIISLISRVIGEPIADFDIPGGDPRFFLRRGDSEIDFELSMLGTGFSQVFILVAFLLLNRQKPYNIFIEEPENNLHPSAVVRLVKLIEQFPEHRIFISSHSAYLIDQANENWTIHQVTQKPTGASVITPCSTIPQKHNLLDSMGIRASQILQSNIIIWVEGPSDRVYLKKWISDLSGNDFSENEHYSFLLYGGSNLTSFDVLTDDEKIDIFKSSRYSLIISDSDRRKDDDELKQRVLNLRKKIEGNSEMNNFIKFGITPGREIENLIPSEIWNLVASESRFQKKWYKEDKSKILLETKAPTPTPQLGPNDIFEKFLASKYYLRKDGDTISKSGLKKISDKYNQNKVPIANFVCESWGNGHYSEEIKSFVIPIIEHIKVANGLT
ncbi:MAG: AAA family ATPase [Bacteroidia bacterium]|nr:AAA family ATPase [Bacteroidia bacterium]